MSVSSTSTVRSLEVWFGDGDVVLQADDSLFKVHGKTLRQHSFVLDQMLEDSDEEADRCDGCPVVPVRDAGGDMSAFLRFMYTPRCVSYHCNSLMSDLEVRDTKLSPNRQNRCRSQGSDLCTASEHEVPGSSPTATCD